MFLVPPHWISQPQDSFVVLGHSVWIDCRSSGTPEPTVMWKKARGKDLVESIRKQNLPKPRR